MTLFHVYTDGACSGNPGPGGWAAVILDADKQPLLEVSGFQADTTNNRMEILAAVAGIAKTLELSPNPEIVLYSDSSYLVNANTKGWMNSWLLSNWKNGSVKNQDLWQELNSLLRQVKIRWVKVKGHSDNIFNNRCDQLAVAEVKKNAPGVIPVIDNAALHPRVFSDNKGQPGGEQHYVDGIKGIKLPPYDPTTLNNPLSKKPSENRCLVSLSQLPMNAAKIKQVADRCSYRELKNLLDPGTVGSVNSSVAYATFNHPTQKVHPFFLQVGDMTDFWLALNAERLVPYPAPSRTELVKYICAFIMTAGVEKARQLGL